VTPPCAVRGAFLSAEKEPEPEGCEPACLQPCNRGSHRGSSWGRTPGGKGHRQGLTECGGQAGGAWQLATEAEAK